jgi:hypothetical protein
VTATVDDKTRLRDARRVITELTRACRQTLAYLDGISCLDQNRLKRALKDSVRVSDEFMRAGE